MKRRIQALVFAAVVATAGLVASGAAATAELPAGAFEVAAQGVIAGAGHTLETLAS
jgi:hypothetical protein